MSILPARRPRSNATSTVLPSLPSGTTISAAEALERFPFIADLCEPEEAGVEEVIVYEGDVAVAEVRTLAAPDQRRFVIVEGDLFCEGSFTQGVSQDEGSYLAVFVKGSMFAADVAMSGDAKLWVVGDLEVEDLVAAGNGSDGFVHVEGRLDARLVVLTADNQLSAREIDAVVVGPEEAIKPVKPTFASVDEVVPAFEPHALGKDGRFSLRDCYVALKSGKRALRADA